MVDLEQCTVDYLFHNLLNLSKPLTNLVAFLLLLCSLYKDKYNLYYITYII